MTTPVPPFTEWQVRARVLAVEATLRDAHDTLSPLVAAFGRTSDWQLGVGGDVLFAISSALEALANHGQLWEMRAQQAAVELVSNSETPHPEYGNEVSCANCGDEWSPLSEQNYCAECQQLADE